MVNDALSAALGMANVVPAFRGTFYRHRTFATMLREFEWNREPYLRDGELRTREKIRAGVVADFARCYWPMDLVEQFVREGWERWVREEPEWFDDEFRARVPPEFTPGPTPE